MNAPFILKRKKGEVASSNLAESIPYINFFKPIKYFHPNPINFVGFSRIPESIPYINGGFSIYYFSIYYGICNFSTVHDSSFM